MKPVGIYRLVSGYNKRLILEHTRVYPKVSGLASCSKDCKWYSSLPLAAVVSLFCESV